jgi:Fur family transcriptional regulator, peroxide stress response regulator
VESACALCERLRERGYAVTPQRRTIFEVLEGAKHHPSAEQVFEEVRRRLPDVSLATVYKTLKELVAMGEIQELNFHGDRSRFDPRTDRHSHLKCERCGRMEDIDMDFGELDLPRKHRAGFEIKRHEVIFYGLCPGCRKAEKPA